MLFRSDPYPRPLQIAAAAAVAVLLASVLTFFIERPALRAIREAYKRRKLRSRAPVPAATPHPSSPQP